MDFAYYLLCWFVVWNGAEVSIDYITQKEALLYII